MNYEYFCSILNQHIFEGEKKDLLRRIIDRPERFIGLFRPTKPSAKILQYLLQSHEIKMGGAFEEIIEKVLSELGLIILDKNLISENGEVLSLNQYFTDEKKYYFIEQKIRDDHDSTKKRGQIINFEAKLNILQNKHKVELNGIIYFIDPELSKNKNFYIERIKYLEKFYNVKLYLFYGKELFEFLEHPEIWDTILIWLRQWKESLQELPEINFDNNPKKNFDEIKDLEIRRWRQLFENNKLWEEGIIKALFREG